AGERFLRAGPLHELRVPVAALDLADQVRVGIDQPREHRVLGQVDLHRRSVVIADRLDPVAADADHAIAEDLPGDDVDQPPGADAGDGVAHDSVSRNDGSADTSATSICAFCSRPEECQFIACQRVNWSSTHTPDCRAPLPLRPLPPNGRWASAPVVELFTLTMPAEMRSRNRNPLSGDVVWIE